MSAMAFRFVRYAAALAWAPSALTARVSSSYFACSDFSFRRICASISLSPARDRRQKRHLVAVADGGRPARELRVHGARNRSAVRLERGMPADDRTPDILDRRRGRDLLDLLPPVAVAGDL